MDSIFREDSSSESSDDSPDEEYEHMAPSTAALLRRRQPRHRSHRDIPISKHQRQPRRRTRSSCRTLDRWATVALAIASLAVIRVILIEDPQISADQSGVQLTLRERTHLRLKQRGISRVWNDASAGLSSMVEAKRNTKRKNREVLGPECVRPSWQELQFPTCNEVHAMDLEATLRHQLVTGQSIVGLLADGLWRDVWVVPAGNEDVVVVKTMKPVHDVDHRNLDRHRRDALTMERLTESPFVVNAFGFCGNTVVTEFLPNSLADVLEKGPITDVMRRRRLAREIFLGLQALHTIPGGPIVHADLDARQLLVAPNGQLKLNDFNRCRFMAQRKDGEPCRFRIPSAPGKARSPEEYADEELDEKIDVFSAGNILYTLLTGDKKWSDYSTAEIKDFVRRGVVPVIELAIDPGLVDVAYAAFEKDPLKRPSAMDLARRIELLLAQH